jgi:hypothetical protein
MKVQETVSREKYVRPQTGLKARLAWRNCFLPRLFLHGLVLSATVALIPGRPSAVRAVTTGHGAWLQQHCADQVVNPVVTNNGDSGAGSLRQAITDACDGSTITFGNTVTSPITLTTADLVIDKNLTITGPGANLLTVERSSLAGTPLFRIFTINSGLTVTISGLTVTNGFINAQGGGILVAGGFPPDISTLTVTNSTISGNSAGGGGGGIYNSEGTVTLTNSTISGNQTKDGGGIYNDGNSSIFINGGGILNRGIVTLTNSTISGNSAYSVAGGGIYNDGASVTLVNTTISGNQAIWGGGIYYAGGFLIDSGTLNVTNSTISGNSTSGGDGGGIFISGGGIVTLTNSTISGNSAYSVAGGGGIANESPYSTFTVRARASIIAGNSPFKGGVRAGRPWPSDLGGLQRHRQYGWQLGIHSGDGSDRDLSHAA